MGCFYHQPYQKNWSIFIAIDNKKLQTDTFNGRNQLYGTAIAVQKQLLFGVQTTNGDKKNIS